MNISFRTLGCKMNWLDSARVQAALQTAGHVIVENEDDADIVFVNSCTVTGRADRQSRQETHHALKKGKETAVFGCGPRVEKKKWQENFPNALVFQDEKEILKYFDIPEDELEFPLQGRTRIPVAIQTGCDNKCTFCITRIARGKTEDFPIKNILRQVQRARECNVQEVVLTGIQLASWGCGDSEKSPEKSQLPELLQTILDTTDIPRIRMSSLGPQFLDERFFEVFKNPRICDHLHLSIQSGSPEILEKMNRGHGLEEILYIAEEAKKVRPNVALTADIIVGFPGETEEHFQETIKMAKKIGLSKMHVFPFSSRKGTGAANFPNPVSSATKKRRAKELRHIGDDLRKEFIHNQMGKQMEILIEEKERGLSKNYIRVHVPKARNNTLCKISFQKESS